MAITQNPLIGRSSGKFSGAVFQTVYSKNIIRARPFKYRDKQSSEQLLQRSKFVVAQAWVIQFLLFIRTYFGNFGTSMSPYAFALGWYIKNAVIWDTDHFRIDYPAAKFSFGTLLTDIFPDEIMFFNHTYFEFIWNNNSGSGNALADDVIHFVILNTATGYHEVLNIERNMGIFADHLTSVTPGIGDKLHMWYFISRANEAFYSDTVYLGEFTALEV